jgi:hypothetical protein
MMTNAPQQQFWPFGLQAPSGIEPLHKGFADF